MLKMVQQLFFEENQIYLDS